MTLRKTLVPYLPRYFMGRFCMYYAHMYIIFFNIHVYMDTSMHATVYLGTESLVTDAP